MSLEIPSLGFQRRLQNPLEYLFMTLFERLLHRLWPVNGRQPSVPVTPAR